MGKKKINLQQPKTVPSKHQTIVFDEYVYDDVKKVWKLPKYITSDVEFQLIFGFKYPKDNWRTPRTEQSMHVPSNYKYKKY